MVKQSPHIVRNRRREAILRFYAAMTGRAYNDVLHEWQGKTLESGSNKLFVATETALSYMEEDS